MVPAIPSSPYKKRPLPDNSSQVESASHQPPRYKRLRFSETGAELHEDLQLLSASVCQAAESRMNDLSGLPVRGEGSSSECANFQSGSSSLRPFSLIEEAPLSYASDDWGNFLVGSLPTLDPDASTPPGTPPRRLETVQPPVISRKMKNRASLNQRDPYIQNTFAIKERLSGLRKGDFPFTIEVGSKEVEIESNQGFLGAGCYQNAYLVTGRGLGSPQFVLKVPKEELLNSVDGHIMIGLVGKDIRHYPEIIQAFEGQENFRVARQYDMDILLEETAWSNGTNPIQMVHGCRLVEYIPQPIPDGPLPELLLHRLKDFLAFCWKNKHLRLDVQKSNLHMEELYVNGEIADYRIVLIDPVHPQDAFEGIIDQTLASFAPKNSELYQFLDPRG